ncbi:uncharacterized protein LOC113874240 [Abrus precatorius]|uniref:Uncharacterized protein LOC113874240 n=1 Tax=Abrus precatorius TaxID=3816 RepID=A0A8B8MKY5_ABRPR|nr:uncharacterized protein LOC113874240 [Abrus precatorius]
MARRVRDDVMETLLGRVVDILERQNEPVLNRGLSEFCKNKPSQFRGVFNPDGAQLWIEELEKIYEAMVCTEEEKVTYAAFMLVGEAEYWWRITRQQLETEGIMMSVGEYAAKFDELSKYCPYFAQADDRSRCSKFESELRPDIKQAISCQQVQHFPTLVDRCRIYENDTKACQTLLKQSGPHRPAHSFGSKGNEVQERRKPYFTPTRSYWSEPIKS